MAEAYWFSDCYRRNLVDMHIEDWDPAFLSEFSPEEYVRNLKTAHIQAPMIYLQSHVGLCYFPTKVGHMHRALEGREDMIRRLVDLCHAEGMKVVGYYSLIFNAREEDAHPDWALIFPDGKTRRQQGSRHGALCPNNPGHRAFLRDQIREIADCFTLDGMFYDMTFWPGVCHCRYCKRLYKAATGRDDYPQTGWSDPDYRTWMRLRTEQIGDFARFVTDVTKLYMPGVTVEHNYANAVASNGSECGSSELVNDACDYTGGDLYGDLYNHSFTAKYYYGVTKNPPFEYMTCRADRSLLSHTNTKSEDALAVEVMLTAAHHGASFIIDAIDPVGTLDRRVYERVGRVFERQMPYEPYFGGRMVQDVAVWYSTTGRFNSRGLPYTSKTCAVNLTKTFIEANVPVGVVADKGTDDLSVYEAVFVPAAAGLSDKNRADILRYVEGGGFLYFSGVEDAELMKLLLGGTLRGYTEEKDVYLAPTKAGEPFFGPFTAKYPLPSEYSLPVADGFADAEVLATMTLPYTKANEQRFASIHSNPPGIPTEIPALVTKRVGRGRVVWSAAPIENDPRRAHRDFMLALTYHFVDRGSFSVRSGAPRQVETVTFLRENDLLVSAVDLLCTDELIPVAPFTVDAACPFTPRKVVRLASGTAPEKEIPFTFADGRCTFRTEPLVMFDMYRIVG